MGHTRREFIKRTAPGLVGVPVLGAVEAPFVWTADKTSQTTELLGERRPSLIVIYLRGGADPLNTIVPYRDEDYYAARPSIAIPAPTSPQQIKDGTAAIPLTQNFGLHPSMEPLAELFKQRQMAAIVNVGSTHETRSHFDAQDFMERAAPGIKSIYEGWLNRYLRSTEKPDDHYLRGFSPQPLLPRSLRGRYPVLAAPGPGSVGALRVFEDLYRPVKADPAAAAREREEAERLSKLSPAKRRAAERARRREEEKFGKPPVTAEQLAPLVSNAGASTVEKLSRLNSILASSERKKRKGYPNGGFPGQLAAIAQIIKAGLPLEISAVDYGGWDHHSYQGGMNGTMANMLRHLSESIRAFVRDLGPKRMRNVVILTMSEFGRTVRENGSQGTDHGHGGFMLAIGGRVNGGKIYGRWTGLSPRSLYQKRDLPVRTDFRDVFAETLAALYRFDSKETGFFPGFKNSLKRPLEFLVRA